MKIDWKLLDNGEIVIDEVDKLTKFENNTIYYEDEYGIHVVDRTNRIMNEDAQMIHFVLILKIIY